MDRFQAGDIVRHFKRRVLSDDNLRTSMEYVYKVIDTNVIDTDHAGKVRVLYETLYDKKLRFVRDKEEFMGTNDKGEYRFEKAVMNLNITVDPVDKNALLVGGKRFILGIDKMSKFKEISGLISKKYDGEYEAEENREIHILIPDGAYKNNCVFLEIEKNTQVVYGILITFSVRAKNGVTFGILNTPIKENIVEMLGGKLEKEVNNGETYNLKYSSVTDLNCRLGCVGDRVTKLMFEIAEIENDDINDDTDGNKE